GVLVRTEFDVVCVEIGRSGQCDARGAFAEINRAALFSVSPILLVRLDHDAVCTQWNRLMLLVQTIPNEFVFSRRSCGTRYRSNPIRVSAQKGPRVRKVSVIFRFVTPEREHANQFA